MKTVGTDHVPVLKQYEQQKNIYPPFIFFSHKIQYLWNFILPHTEIWEAASSQSTAGTPALA